MNITNSISFSGDGLPNSPQILAENIKNLPKIEDIYKKRIAGTPS